MKNKLDSIEDFLDYLPDDERDIADYLRELILDAIPDCREKFIGGIPVYFRHGKICYIRPAAIPRGNVPAYGVQIGFFQGYRMTNDDRYLEKGRRVRVFTKIFAECCEVDPARIRSLLFEATVFDQEETAD
ncbi:MAG: hypothetical protein JW801_15755 [Bacteroidales bacterium]|nr:hypothetical protein [Bacteroidales bacterium]